MQETSVESCWVTDDLIQQGPYGPDVAVTVTYVRTIQVHRHHPSTSSEYKHIAVLYHSFKRTSCAAISFGRWRNLTLVHVLSRLRSDRLTYIYVRLCCVELHTV